MKKHNQMLRWPTDKDASGAVDSGLILSQVKLITVKSAFTASLLDAQHQRDSENKPASLLVGT